MPDLRPWEVLGSRTVSSDRWLTHTLEHVRLPSGLEISQYHVLNQNDFCLMVAVTPACEVPLVRQYKHGARDVVLEFPAGLVEDDETPEDAAARELLEETGYAGRLRRAGTLLTSPSRNRNLAHVFVILDAEQVCEPEPEETEQIEVVMTPLARLPGLVAEAPSVTWVHWRPMPGRGRRFPILAGRIEAGYGRNPRAVGRMRSRMPA